ncbi:MAG TPA: hypothetical protein VG871_22170 [Vicinamibacterales bacterium]|nr:hypothetical protein [Vicinamibacterales bacterium]
MKRILIAAVLLAVALLAPSAARAHDNDKTVMGNISKVEGMNLMVKATDGKEVMVMMDAKTKITQGAKTIDAKALKVGQRVVASGPEAHGMISAETVKVAPPKK